MIYSLMRKREVCTSCHPSELFVQRENNSKLLYQYKNQENNYELLVTHKTYPGSNMEFSNLYLISNTNSCHKWATALRPPNA